LVLLRVLLKEPLGDEAIIEGLGTFDLEEDLVLGPVVLRSLSQQLVRVQNAPLLINFALSDLGLDYFSILEALDAYFLLGLALEDVAFLVLGSCVDSLAASHAIPASAPHHLLLLVEVASLRVRTVLGSVHAFSGAAVALAAEGVADRGEAVGAGELHLQLHLPRLHDLPVLVRVPHPPVVVVTALGHLSPCFLHYHAFLLGRLVVVLLKQD
jgi:hypothetical protein